MSESPELREMLYHFRRSVYELDENGEMIWIDCCRVLKTKANDDTSTFTTTLVEELPDTKENHEKLRDKYGRDKYSLCRLYL